MKNRTEAGNEQRIKTCKRELQRPLMKDIETVSSFTRMKIVFLRGWRNDSG